MDSKTKVIVIISSQSSHEVNPKKIAKRHESIRYLSAFLGSPEHRKESNLDSRACTRDMQIS